MKRFFTFLAAALMSVGMFAVPQAQQGEPVDVTIGSWSLKNWGDDGELYLYSPDSTIRFYFDLIYGQDASDLILGKEYTVGDVYVDEEGPHAGIYTNGDWVYRIKSLSLIKTIDADQHVHFVGSVVDIIDRAFTFHYDEEAAPTAVENVQASKAQVAKTKKIFRNGQMFILKDGEIFNLTGTKVK